jgi:sugar phosphate isomerase/epimerase
MIAPGLLSVTFRQLAPDAIVSLARECGLRVVEWGGDIHVPAGDFERAREVRKITADAGLSTAAYGSYYRLLAPDRMDFEQVLATAHELGAPAIRVWAGTKGSWESDEAHFDAVVAESLRLADLAKPAGIQIAFEFHGGTINDTCEAAIRFLNAVRHPAIATYWQPPLKMPDEDALDGLRTLLPDVRDVHAFSWTVEESGIVRHALSARARMWGEVFGILRSTGRDHAVMLEFVRGDSIDAFREDARWLMENLSAG